jgi:hypothetical protein
MRKGIILSALLLAALIINQVASFAADNPKEILHGSRTPHQP